MTFEEIKQGEETYIMHTYGRFPIALDHGKGATLWDTDGKKYIDLTSGIGVNSLGHDNEALTTAVSEQAHKLMHACNLYYTEPMVQTAKKLVDAAGMGKIFFANSGAEANEGMIKLARKYSFDKCGSSPVYHKFSNSSALYTPSSNIFLKLSLTAPTSSL